MNLTSCSYKIHLVAELSGLSSGTRWELHTSIGFNLASWIIWELEKPREPTEPAFSCLFQALFGALWGCQSYWKAGPCSCSCFAEDTWSEIQRPSCLANGTWVVIWVQAGLWPWHCGTFPLKFSFLLQVVNSLPFADKGRVFSTREDLKSQDFCCRVGLALYLNFSLSSGFYDNYQVGLAYTIRAKLPLVKNPDMMVILQPYLFFQLENYHHSGSEN